MKFSNLNRSALTSRLTEEEFEVLIIGGGITGAGIALDASSRGMKTALIEMQDFAAGTSSRSTKLVHGGLRYLKQFEVKMVAEVGKERAIVYENGPHVTTPEWMLLPMHKGGTFGTFSTSIGLRVYDFLAAVKKSERRSMLTALETKNKEPLVKSEGLRGGGYYVEYRTDDARLTMEVLKEAADKGAVIVNYTKAEDLLYQNGTVVGSKVVDVLTGEEYSIKSKKIINASGPWVDDIRKIDGSMDRKSLKLTKGVHVVIDQTRFPLRQAVYFDTPDKRMVFAIPRDGKAYVGTTDTFFKDDPVNPKMTKSDQDYLIGAINFMFPDVHITEHDIESSWAGVRPLIWEEGKDPSEISRKDEIWESQSGLITIAGGKLTGYRKMAEMIVNLISQKFKIEGYKIFSECNTKNMPISGGHVGGSKGFAQYVIKKVQEGIAAGLTEEEAAGIVKMYGSNADEIFAILSENKANQIDRCSLPLVLWAKLEYSIRFEMAVTPIDFFMRRTGDLLFNIDNVFKYKSNVADYMGHSFQWDEQTKHKYIQDLERQLNEATIPADDL